jgi:hypothetical protein
MAICPYCGAEVQAGEKFCGKCGKKLAVSKFLTDENKYWKWGSMIVSLVIILIAWVTGIRNPYYDEIIYPHDLVYPYSAYLENSTSYYTDIGSIYPDYSFIFWGWLIAFPIIIYLMYIERTKKIKYCLSWISLVVVLDLTYLLAPHTWINQSGPLLMTALFLIAIALDSIYFFKTQQS